MATNYLDKTGLAKYTKEIKEIIKEAILEDNKKKYYVGKIIIETANVNPATYLGFGTWQYWGGGRVPVGVDTSQTEFNTVEKTGGSKYMQKHFHREIKWSNPDSGAPYTTSYLPGDTQALDIPVTWVDMDSETTNRMVTSYSGEGDSENLQPYITCYMWKRIK